MRESVEIKLKKRLKQLQDQFGTGHELTLKYLPGEVRYSDNDKPLSGEIQANVIFIYEEDEKKALHTLNHEFIEFMIHPILKSYTDWINVQNQLLLKLVCEKKEEIVEKISKSMN